MPVIPTTFIDGLIAAENPPKGSIALAAKGFVDAFVPYIKGATSNYVPIIQPMCDSPAAQSALQGGIASAFALASGPAAADAMGVAILAFFNAGPASAFFAGAIGAGIGTGLGTYMSGISAPVPGQQPAKAAVVAAITTWMAAGPAGLFIIFPGSPDIKAPIS